MIKVMFVCHGNICRSPMAEFILKDMVKKQGKEDKFYICSSATSNEEIWNGIGNPIYPPARAKLLEHGINVGEKRAVRFKPQDYENFDYIICMDSNNVRNALRILGKDYENKVKKLLEYAGETGDVSDPWYSRDFETAYNDIYRGCKAFLEFLNNK